jgi:glucose/arabinose dehydrogenase
MAAAVLLFAAAAGCGSKAATAPAPEPAPAPSPGTPSAGHNTTGIGLTLQAGLSIDVFASGLVDPRVIAWDPAGNMLVSIPSQGRVVALPDPQNTGVAQGVVEVMTGLNLPHGLAFRSTGAVTQLYIAETDQVAVYDYDRQSMKASNKTKILDLPGGGKHFTRTLQFLPDQDRLLVAVGSDCNVCYESDPRRAAITVCNPDGSNSGVYASGLRNSVFMTVRPGTTEVWATEMGRDLLGDDVPPDEINIITEGGDYGWPTCYGANVHDSQFDPNPSYANPCAGKTPAHITMQAHSAPLGLDFFPASGWPAGYSGNLVVAFHGSWNRSVPTGDKVVLFRLDAQGNYQSVEDFITGWMQPDGSYLGRPTGAAFHGNALYVADDVLGYVYRVTYGS